MKDSFKNLTLGEKRVKRDELSKQYFDLRFQMIIGHVDNPVQKRVLRRKIARLNTIISAEERGVPAGKPAASATASPPEEKKARKAAKPAAVAAKPAAVAAEPKTVAVEAKAEAPKKRASRPKAAGAAKAVKPAAAKKDGKD
jgi:large subunit ribosomal protein L29